MSLQCGIVGLPNVGKSTLFNALTKAGIAAENYPFCTIEPNVGVVEVPDPRLQQLAEIIHPERIVPAIVEFVDIAGLVKGASKGEGLMHLADLMNVDRSNTIGIGDNENDLALVKMANVGVAVSNAVDEVKEVADFITVDNNSSAVAAVIYALDDGKIKFE